MWLNHANKSHRTKIIITKDTILGAKKSFFSQNNLNPELLNNQKIYFFN